MRDQPPAVSVIVPVYDGARYLRECLDSVFEQTFRDFEVIVVDDGSTDDSMAIAREFDVVVLRQPNRGQAVARNRGADMAKGRYLAFIDGDDSWLPQRLQAGVAALERHPECALAYSDVDVTDEKGSITQRGLLAGLGDHPKQSLKHCLERDMYFVPSSVTLRKSVFNQLAGFDESLRGYEDEEFFVRIFAYAPVHFMPETLVRWRQHAGGTTKSRRFYESRIAYLNKLLRTYPDRPAADEYFASRSIAPRFFDYYRDDYLSALDGHGPDIAPDELRRGMLATLPYLQRQSLPIWLLAHLPYRLMQTFQQIERLLPASWNIRRRVAPAFKRR